MYSNFKFQSAKTDLAFAFTHKPTDSMGQVEIAFLRALMTALYHTQHRPSMPTADSNRTLI